MDNLDDKFTSNEGEFPDKQYSIRVVLPELLYKTMKGAYPEHGQISQLIRNLLIKHLESLPQ